MTLRVLPWDSWSIFKYHLLPLLCRLECWCTYLLGYTWLGDSSAAPGSISEPFQSRFSRSWWPTSGLELASTCWPTTIILEGQISLF